MSADEMAGAVTVELPCGLLKDGKLQTAAEIIPMTGAVRKMIARPEIRQNPAKVIDTILLQCVKSVGSVPKLKKDVADRLFMADRDFLIMEIRRISLGDKVNSVLQCGSCNAKLNVSIDLRSDVPVKKLEDVSHKIEGENVTFKLVDASLKLDATFRFPNGSDQHAVAMLYKKNPIEANYALYQRCLISWNGTPAEDLPSGFFETQGLKIVDYIDENFMENMPGPDMRVPMNCNECSAEIVLSMESSDFLFRTPKTERT